MNSEDVQPTSPEDPVTEGSVIDVAEISEEPIPESVPSGDEPAPQPDDLFPDPALQVSDLEQRISLLQVEEQQLRQDIEKLKATRDRLLQEQTAGLQVDMKQFMQDYLGELKQRKQALQLSIEQLERRQERIRNEMRTTFAGSSQEVAIRVQGFRDYLVGSLQDLVTAAEQLQLIPPAPEPEIAQPQSESRSKQTTVPKFAEQTFEEQAKRIRSLLDRYRTSPDYYGSPWQLRRTFEPIHADRVSKWFFVQGGRGALKSMGSRLQNILITSAIISVLYRLYGDSLRTLILANSPERLGEWRRGLQDCLGISRGDFGPDQGVILSESPDVLIQKADRITQQEEIPFIVIDESENQISLALLQFPLWLAFAADPQLSRGSYY